MRWVLKTIRKPKQIQNIVTSFATPVDEQMEE
jgi:hypothetical protein